MPPPSLSSSPRKEPRHGERLTLGGTVHTPQGPLLVYSVHLEVGGERSSGVRGAQGVGSKGVRGRGEGAVSDY